jgi:hypothetical protein
MHIHHALSVTRSPPSEVLKDPPAGEPVWTRRSFSDAASPSVLVPEPSRDTRDASAPAPRRRPLGEMLRPPLLAKFEASQARRGAHILSRVANNKLDHLQPGALLGSGSGKDAFDLPGKDQVLLVCKPGAPSMVEELLTLDQLKNAGMPTAKVLSVGSYRGSEAMVMPKFDAIFKPAPPDSKAGREFLESPRVSPFTLGDLVRIRDTIRREGIVVYDLQYGIDRSGHLHVLDPRGVSSTGDSISNHGQLQALDELIAAVDQRLTR